MILRDPGSHCNLKPMWGLAPGLDGDFSRDSQIPGSHCPWVRHAQVNVRTSFLALSPHPRGATVRCGAVGVRGNPGLASGASSRAPRPGEAQNFPAGTLAPRRGLLGKVFSREEAEGRGSPRVCGARGNLGASARLGRGAEAASQAGARGSRSRQSRRASP